MILKNLFLPNRKRRSKSDISDFIKNNFFNLVVLILLVTLLLKSCKSTPSENGGIKVIRDTTWIVKDSTIYSKPQIIKTIPIDVSRDTIINNYLPDTNYQKLVQQYQSVVNELLAKNIYLDSVKIDTIGWVKVLDTVSKNQISGRTFKYSYKYPVIKETRILPPEIKNQVFVGGFLQGVKGEPINAMSAGFLFKNKHDYVFGASAGFNRDGNIVYGVQSYWKISLKKQK